MSVRNVSNIKQIENRKPPLHYFVKQHSHKPGENIHKEVKESGKYGFSITITRNKMMN